MKDEDLLKELSGNTVDFYRGDGSPLVSLDLETMDSGHYDYTPVLDQIHKFSAKNYQMVAVSSDWFFNDYWTTFITLMHQDLVEEYQSIKVQFLPLNPHMNRLPEFSARYAHTDKIVHIVCYDT